MSKPQPTPPASSVQPKGLFPTTRWTMVRSLGDNERALRFIAWDEFCRAYRSPLQTWLQSKVGDPHEAEELIQSFLAKLPQKEHLLKNLSPSAGKLRSWLLASLRNHWIDACRAKKPGATQIPDDLQAPSAADELYDREWALSLSRRVISNLRDEYLARGKPELYHALIAALDTPEDTDRSAVADTLGMTPNSFAVAFMRFRERLAVRIRKEVSATLIDDDPAEIEAELRHLIRTLSHSGGMAAVTRSM